MKAKLYEKYDDIYFNPSTVNYLIEDGFECIAHFQGGKKTSLSYSSVRDTLIKKFPRVFSLGLMLPIYINPQNVISYKSGFMGMVTFKDGKSLNELSGTDLDDAIEQIEENSSL